MYPTPTDVFAGMESMNPRRSPNWEPTLGGSVVDQDEQIERAAISA